MDSIILPNDESVTPMFHFEGEDTLYRWNIKAAMLHKDPESLFIGLHSYHYSESDSQEQTFRDFDWPGGGLRAAHFDDGEAALVDKLGGLYDVLMCARCESRELVTQSLTGDCQPFIDFLESRFAFAARGQRGLPLIDCAVAAATILRTNFDPLLAMQATNMTIRNNALMVVGTDRLFTELPNRMVAQAKDPGGRPIRLFEFDDLRDWRVLEVVDATPGKPNAYLRTAPEIDDPEEALASLALMDRDTYYKRLVVET